MEKNLLLIESLIFKIYGEAYRNFVRSSSPISDPTERIAGFITQNFRLTSDIELAQFTAETLGEILSNTSNSAPPQTSQNTPDDSHPIITSDHIQIKEEQVDISEVQVFQDGNGVGEIEGEELGEVKPDILGTLEPEVEPIPLPANEPYTCGHCRTRSGDFQTLEELVQHQTEKHCQKNIQPPSNKRSLNLEQNESPNTASSKRVKRVLQIPQDLIPPKERAIESLLSKMDFTDLKNSRLVCKLWDTSAVNLLSRKDMKLVKLPEFGENSDKFSEFLNSFKQLPNPQLFKGFKLEVDQIPIVLSTNILPRFNPTKICLDFDSFWSEIGPFMSKLIKSIKSSLLELELHNGEFSYLRPSLQLEDLTDLEGLGLKKLTFSNFIIRNSSFENGLEFAKIFQNFLESQSSTLEELDLDLNIYENGKDPATKKLEIKLPCLSKMRTLTMSIKGEIINTSSIKKLDWEAIMPLDFNISFPYLVDLTLGMPLSPKMMGWTIGHPLKRFKVHRYQDLGKIKNSFPHLEELLCTKGSFKIVKVQK